MAKLARLTALPLALSAMALTASARAQNTPAPTNDVQNSIALDQFDPAPPGDLFFGVPSPFARGRVVPRGYVMLDYADQPLRIAGQTSGLVVASQMFLHIGASLAILDRGLISVSLPVAVMQSGDDSLAIDGKPISTPTSASLGDLRIGARVRIVGEDDGPAQFGVGGYVYVPTGALDGKGSFTGDSDARVAPHLLFGGRIKIVPQFALAYTTMAGVSVKASENPTTVVYGAGLAALLLDDSLQIGPEFYGATPIQPGNFTLVEGEDVGLSRDTNIEILGGAKWRFFEGLSVGFAGGAGLTKAMGTPAFRIAATIAWVPTAKPTAAGGGGGDLVTDDADKDGILDAADGCPYSAGVASKDAKKNGCPVIDDDDDGVPNEEDQCPTEYAKVTDKADKKGCPPAPPPPDTDGDGIADEKDACPKEAGPISQDSAKNGCAPPPNLDVDGDGVTDSEDACPGDKGVKSADPKANGCKTLVRIKDKTIIVSAAIEFKVSKVEPPPIEPSAEPALTQLQETLTEHPEIIKLEIGAYTDNEGKEKFNIKVSQARADAVKKWLVDKGVAEGRLVAVGYGPKNPIADNKTKEGRAQNKRIEFTILEKK